MTSPAEPPDMADTPEPDAEADGTAATPTGTESEVDIDPSLEPADPAVAGGVSGDAVADDLGADDPAASDGGAAAAASDESEEDVEPSGADDVAGTAGVSDAAEDGEPGAERDDARVAEVGSTWWAWVVRRRRRLVLLVAGVLVVVLVATLVLVSALTPGPKGVVQDYLDAIRAGDTERALAISGEPPEGRIAFLTADALADDWTVDAVTERHRFDDEADVDVTISRGKTSEQGRFHLLEGDDGWKIESPFVQVDLDAGELVNLDIVELGDARRAVGSGVDPTGAVTLLVFPGVYELYPRYAKRFTVDPAVLVAVPQESDERSQQVSASYTLTGASERQAERAINARVDECAKEPDIDPTGCPFNAEDAAVVRALDDLNDITWTVVAYPEARLIDGSGELGTVLRTPGTVTLTGSGVPVEPEGAARTTFTLTCEFGLNNLVVALSADGVAAGRGAGDDVYAAQSTRCF